MKRRIILLVLLVTIVGVGYLLYDLHEVKELNYAQNSAINSLRDFYEELWVKNYKNERDISEIEDDIKILNQVDQEMLEILKTLNKRDEELYKVVEKEVVE